MSVRSPHSNPGIVLARLLLAGVLIVHGGWRLWAAYQGAPASGAALSVSTAALVLGVLVAAAWRVRVTAMLAAALVVAVAVASHPFWTMRGSAFSSHLLEFVTDAGVASGFVLLALVSATGRRR